MPRLGGKGWQMLTVEHLITYHFTPLNLALSLALSCVIASAHGSPARAVLSYGPQLSLLSLSFKFCKVKDCKTHRSYYSAPKTVDIFRKEKWEWRSAKDRRKRKIKKGQREEGRKVKKENEGKKKDKENKVRIKKNILGLLLGGT